MKTIKILSLLFLTLIFSCNQVEDLLCDQVIKQVTKEYKEEIGQVENSTNLTVQEKEEQINILITERDKEIVELKEECKDVL